MKKRILALFNLILFTCAGCMAADEAAGNTEAEAEADGVAEKLIKRARQNKVWPLTSDLVPGLDLAGAYAIQRSLVAANLPGDKISGFKAALTTGSAQERFGLKKAAAGVLLDSMRRSGMTDLALEHFYRPMLELEVAFVVGKRIDRPLEDVSELKTHIRSAMPAFELPDLRFADMEEVSGLDIIAVNTVASAFIVGSEVPGVNQDFGEMEVRLLHEGKVLKEGSGPGFTGDPWAAALKLVNHAVAQGWTVEPGHILLSGAMSGLTPVEAGNYEARFSGLGIIHFTIR